MGDTRRYVSFHNLTAQQILAASVAWNGDNWKVTIDDHVMPDCCDTIEEAYTVAEREIARRFPSHSCQHSGCKLWQYPADGTA
jgi:hypothetical protein